LLIYFAAACPYRSRSGAAGNGGRVAFANIHSKMRLAAVTTVRNECDIIESFVRHNAAFLDCFYILDHRSTDATPVILRKLTDEGLPVLLSREDRGISTKAQR